MYPYTVYIYLIFILLILLFTYISSYYDFHLHWKLISVQNLLQNFFRQFHVWLSGITQVAVRWTLSNRSAFRAPSLRSASSVRSGVWTCSRWVARPPISLCSPPCCALTTALWVSTRPTEDSVLLSARTINSYLALLIRIVL